MLNIITAIYIWTIAPLVQVPDQPKCPCESIKGECPCSAPLDDECTQQAIEILRERLMLDLQAQEQAEQVHAGRFDRLQFFILEMQPGASTPQ